MLFKRLYLLCLLTDLFSITSFVSAYTYVEHRDLRDLTKQNVSHTILSSKNTLFYPQAPLWNWKKYMESCEEASSSLLWRNSYQFSQITAKEFSNEIDSINQFEEKTWIQKNKVVISQKTKEKWTYLRDLSLEEISINILEWYFKLKWEDIFILENPSIQEIDTLLNNNFFLLAPINTWEIKNPFITHPSYHIVLLWGYTTTSFISFDVATKNGFKLEYEKELFLSSIRKNWNKVLFINSTLSSFSQLRNIKLEDEANRISQQFKIELQKKLWLIETITSKRTVLKTIKEKVKNLSLSTSVSEKSKLTLQKIQLVILSEEKALLN